MKNHSFLILFLLISISSFAQIDYQKRAEKNLIYLIRDEVLLSQIKIDDEGVKIFSQDDLNNPELMIKWENAEAFLALCQTSTSISEKDIIRAKKKNLKISDKKPTSIKGMRIALDPGHFANNMETAILEKKFMKINKKDVGLKKDIAFYEADLAWETAYILAKRLEKRGAKVFITRKKGKSTFGCHFKKWKKKKFKETLNTDLANQAIDRNKYTLLSKKGRDKDIYSYMNQKDIQNRAKIINASQPDITINIHYNASSDRTDKDGNFPAISNNYCMAFTGGGFMKNELNTKEARIHFLRLLLSSDLEQSIALSASIMKHHKGKAKVPIIANKNNIRYLQRNSVYGDEPGVYCRNLALTRTVLGPLCFGESLMQDNINEAVILNLKNYKESGVKTSSRVKLVVDAFEAGILEYVNL